MNCQICNHEIKKPEENRDVGIPCTGCEWRHNFIFHGSQLTYASISRSFDYENKSYILIKPKSFSFNLKFTLLVYDKNKIVGSPLHVFSDIPSKEDAIKIIKLQAFL